VWYSLSIRVHLQARILGREVKSKVRLVYFLAEREGCHVVNVGILDGMVTGHLPGWLVHPYFYFVSWAPSLVVLV